MKNFHKKDDICAMRKIRSLVVAMPDDIITVQNLQNQSTRIHKLVSAMHYGASNEIKEIEVCKKCPKVEPYFVPIFDPIVVKPCLDDAK